MAKKSNGVIIEKEWEHNGLKCEVRIMPMGHRCGYVAVDDSHPFYGIDYDCLPEDFEPDVNGGLTYSRQEGGSWVFGFDFAHCWDKRDPSLASEEYSQWLIDNPDTCGRVATLDIAAADCENLADALSERKGKEYVYTIDGYLFNEKHIPDAIMCRGVRYEKVKA